MSTTNNNQFNNNTNNEIRLSNVLDVQSVVHPIQPITSSSDRRLSHNDQHNNSPMISLDGSILGIRNSSSNLSDRNPILYQQQGHINFHHSDVHHHDGHYVIDNDTQNNNPSSSNNNNNNNNNGNNIFTTSSNNIIGGQQQQQQQDDYSQDVITLVVEQHKRIDQLEEELQRAQDYIAKLQEYVTYLESDKKNKSKKQNRYWTQEEHQLFLEGIEKYGKKDVKEIANFIGTRNVTQVRTHAQKYYAKIDREQKKHKPLVDKQEEKKTKQKKKKNHHEEDNDSADSNNQTLVMLGSNSSNLSADKLGVESKEDSNISNSSQRMTTQQQSTND